MHFVHMQYTYMDTEYVLKYKYDTYTLARQPILYE